MTIGAKASELRGAIHSVPEVSVLIIFATVPALAASPSAIGAHGRVFLREGMAVLASIRPPVRVAASS